MAFSKRLALLAARSALSAGKPRRFCSSNGRPKDSKLSKSESETKIYKIYPERLPWAEEKLAKIDENSAKMRSATIFFFCSRSCSNV
ncbi:predicted protein [Arabidopsis lyrata subsp. lyrata]|uniref:Predicted protein n=1 Tax=Arabidopsis lyrata subsp. lyrata TaxID=81972 RepID=D7M3P2_ARALL|nr:predicted protein [Arabidopsis lyrata subsp. lyrata]